MFKKECEGCNSPFKTEDERVVYCTECHRQQDAEGDDRDGEDSYDE